MRRSIFFKIALLIIPIVLAFEVIELYNLYRTYYDTTLESCTKTTENAAEIASEYFEFFDPNEPHDTSRFSELFSHLCMEQEISYAYAVEVDVENDSERYLVIGYGETASDKVKEQRHPGDVVEGTLSDAQIRLGSGEVDQLTVHEVTELDDTLTSYVVVKQYSNIATGEYTSFEKPVIIGAELSYATFIKRFMDRFYATAVSALAFTLFQMIAIFLILYFRLRGPVRRISSNMKHFVSNREKGFEKLEVKDNDEFADMARSFNIMADEIDSYIGDIDRLTKEKHTQEAELDIARTIQNGLLKAGCFKKDSLVINACMHAARNVGGDFYDYQVLEDGRVYLCIADVSGKGIPAALFMVCAITLLRQYALLGYSPERMLKEYNNTLAGQNPNGLFITTFIAIYDPKAGTLTYSNAGHNHPYIVSDRLIELDGAAGIAAGIFDGQEYEQETVALKTGDTLFLYTDGVNEAENSSGEQFGTETLEEELKKYLSSDSVNIEEEVLKAVKAFSGDADQSDDITILTLRLAPTPTRREITVPAQAENLLKVNEIINDTQGISDDMRFQLLLMTEEIFVNICSYAYGEGTGDLTFAIDVSGDSVSLTFSDSGTPFDPTSGVIDIDDYDHENTIGGLGRYLAFEIADDYAYKYEDGRNILCITKNFEG